MPRVQTSHRSISKSLRALALSLPEAEEDFPWGESVIKVRKKIFVFLGRADETDILSITVKLPSSAPLALSLPGASPTGYGLGRADWVTLRFEKGMAVPVELLRDWILESYGAVAPKRLAARVKEPTSPG
ncbi:MAG: MmcQ/YjbR family DNA-binding protein [Acidobacteriota bacterium]|nr:MmcQ/YjbR family DNA-binding protein [Acidobacteriota bacterium]